MRAWAIGAVWCQVGVAAVRSITAVVAAAGVLDWRLAAPPL